MELSGISNLGFEQTVTHAAKASSQADFASILNRSTAKLDDSQASNQQKEDVLEAAQQLVASALVLPMLAETRQSSLKSDLFNGGFSEDAFGAQLDTHLADRMVGKSNFAVVDAIYQKMIGATGNTSSGKELNTHG